MSPRAPEQKTRARNAPSVAHEESSRRTPSVKARTTGPKWVTANAAVWARIEESKRDELVKSLGTAAAFASALREPDLFELLTALRRLVKKGERGMLGGKEEARVREWARKQRDPKRPRPSVQVLASRLLDLPWEDDARACAKAVRSLARGVPLPRKVPFGALEDELVVQACDGAWLRRQAPTRAGYARAALRVLGFSAHAADDVVRAAESVRKPVRIYGMRENHRAIRMTA